MLFFLNLIQIVRLLLNQIGLILLMLWLLGGLRIKFIWRGLRTKTWSKFEVRSNWIETTEVLTSWGGSTSSPFKVLPSRLATECEVSFEYVLIKLKVLGLLWLWLRNYMLLYFFFFNWLRLHLRVCLLSTFFRLIDFLNPYYTYWVLTTLLVDLFLTTLGIQPNFWSRTDLLWLLSFHFLFFLLPLQLLKFALSVRLEDEDLLELRADFIDDTKDLLNLSFFVFDLKRAFHEQPQVRLCKVLPFLELPPKLQE